MRILIYGAGVIGSIFAGKLSQASHDVTVLARGKRLSEIKKDGIILRLANTNRTEKSHVKLIEKLLPNDLYDYIFVVMQKTQIDDVLPVISENRSRNIIFIVNNALGYDKWISVIGKERLMIGFPSAGGERVEGVVNYFIGKGLIRSFQTTTFGECTGGATLRVKEVIATFNRAGIPSISCNNMDAWQKTHVAMVTSIANILYKYDGDNYNLAKSFADIQLMIRGIKEGFAVLKELGYPVTPAKLNFFKLQTFLLSCVFKPIMGTKLAETTMAKHTVAAKTEMKCLQEEFNKLIAQSGLKTPAIDILETYLFNS